MRIRRETEKVRKLFTFALCISNVLVARIFTSQMRSIDEALERSGETDTTLRGLKGEEKASSRNVSTPLEKKEQREKPGRGSGGTREKRRNAVGCKTT